MKFGNCLNCGEKGHTKRECSKPTVSYGIILLNIQTENIYIVNKIIDSLHVQLPNISVESGLEPVDMAPTDSILIKDNESLMFFREFKDSVRFLLVKRRHTLGYIEFIRGNYKLDNPRGIEYLFKQMIKDEITRLKTMEFDDLWDDLWGKEKASRTREYKESKDKFYKLKNLEDNKINLQFYADNVVPLWLAAEWGFPKGRKNVYNESTMKCAIREFKEETGLGDEDFIVLNKIKPIEEEFNGTNGERYRHVYYLAVSTGDKTLSINKNNKSQYYEIGDITWANFEDTLEMIRPYHNQRKKLVLELFMYLINYINSLPK